MNISQFAIKHQRFSYFLLLMLLIIGLFSYLNHPSLEDPRVVVREALVGTHVPGMSPSQMENLVTKKVEEHIKEIPEVKEVSSTSETGVSIIKVKVKDKYFNMQPIWQKLRNKVEDVKKDLPQGAVGPNVIDDFNQVITISIAITSDGFSLAEMHNMAKKIRDQLYQVSGVGRILLHGVQDERIYLQISASKLSQYKLTPVALVRALQKQNILSAGYPVEAFGRNIIVAPSGTFKSLKDIEKVVIQVPKTSRLLRLGDILEIKRDYIDPQEKPIYFNGQQAIVLAMTMLEKENTVKFGKRVEREIAKIQQTLPVGYEIHLATFQPKLVEESVSQLLSNFYQAFIIVALVVIIFLGLREGLIVGLLIPITVLITLLVMRIIGIELQRVSIASLVISLGLLVDNGVVVAEELRTKIDAGVNKTKTAIMTFKLLSMPLFVSTLTTILVFLPLLLSENVAGEYTRSLSIVIIIALLCSWFLAFFVVPLFGVTFLKHSGGEGTSFARLYNNILQKYDRVLRLLLRRRNITITVVLILLLLASVAFNFVPKQFFPFSERDQFIMFVDLPLQTSMRTTDKKAKSISKYLANKKLNPDIKQNTTFVGYGGVRFYVTLAPFSRATHRAFIIVDTQKGSDVDNTMTRVQNHLRKNYPYIRVRATKLWLGNEETGLVKVLLSGPNINVLKNYTEQVKLALQAISGTEYVMDDWEHPTLRVSIEINQAKARLAGLTSSDIAQSLAAYYHGIQVSKFREEGNIIPIMIRSAGTERYNLERLRLLRIYSEKTSKFIPLAQIATFVPNFEYSALHRFNLRRTVSISAKNTENGSDYLVGKIKPFLEKMNMLPGYGWQLQGETVASQEAQQSLFKYLPLCFALILALLIYSFNSFRKTFIILALIPLALIGAVVGLLIMRATFSFMAILGVLSLAGIIINHGVVLLDQINIALKGGKDHFNAIITSAKSRLRPIVITTVTTIFGLFPLMLFGGPLWYALTVVIIFGLAVGTFITLLVLPVIYAILFKVKSLH